MKTDNTNLYIAGSDLGTMKQVYNYKSELTIDIERLEKYFEGKFYTEENNSHGMDHVRGVYDLAKKMVETLNLNVGQDELLIACYLHDIYSSIDRENHHEKGENHIWEYRGYHYFLKDMDNDVIVRIAKAIAEHRASYKGEYWSELSEVLSAADRGALSTHDTIRRSFAYTMEKNPDMKIQEVLLNVWRHMKGKFGSKGYARYNNVFKNYFKEELEFYQKFMDDLTLDETEYIIFMWIKNCRREDLSKILGQAKTH